MERCFNLCICLIVSIAFSAVGSTSFSQDLDQKSATSLLEAVETNCLAWRNGDVLVRRTGFVDTTVMPEAKGRVEDLEIWTRLIFDYDSQQFLELSFAVYKKQMFGEDSNDDSPNVVTELSGQMYDKSQKLMATLAQGNSTRGKAFFEKSSIRDERIENDCPVSMAFSDYRYFWFYRSKDLKFVKDSLLSCKSGNGYISHSITGKEKITIRMGADDSQVLDRGGLVTNLVFDSKRLLLLSNHSIYRKKGQPDAIAGEFDLKWKSINDIFVPIEAREMAGKAFYDDGGKMVEAGTETTTHHFHWLAINEKLHEEHFRIDNFRDPGWIKKMTDPTLVGAKSLEKFRKKSGRKSLNEE